MATSEQFTHADYWTSKRPNKSLVQVRKNGVVFCGQIVDAITTPNGVDLWHIDTSIGFIFSTPKNVRACGGMDCQCSCVTRWVGEVLQ